ncbi:MAG: hypothetical protein ACPGVT_12915 [Maricaulaceae bacterium]
MSLPKPSLLQTGGLCNYFVMEHRNKISRSGRRTRFFILLAVWVIAACISTLNYHANSHIELGVIGVFWGHFIISIATLPHSFASVLKLGLEALNIDLGHSYNFVVYLFLVPIYWMALIVFQTFYIQKAKRWGLIGTIVVAAISAPHWLLSTLMFGV